MTIRLISAAILLPLTIAAILLGSWPYALLITIVTLIAGLEYVQMFKRKAVVLSLPLIWAPIGLWHADALWGAGDWLVPGMAWIVLLSAAWGLHQAKRAPDLQNATTPWSLALAGGVYLGVGGSFLYRLRALDDGLSWTLTALPIIWIGESVAYLVGRRWGHHKMAPMISPGKSWEGYGGEIVISTVTGALLGWLWPMLNPGVTSLSVWKGLLLGLVLALFSPGGDFFVSLIKREVNVKDSSHLIPGHGGFLDRVDSLLWAGIIAWTLAKLLA